MKRFIPLDEYLEKEDNEDAPKIEGYSEDVSNEDKDAGYYEDLVNKYQDELGM